MQWHLLTLGERHPTRRPLCFLLSRQLDYRERYHWHKAMSLAIRFFSAPFTKTFCAKPALSDESLRISRLSLRPD
jgi:hypothetical protein